MDDIAKDSAEFECGKAPARMLTVFGHTYVHKGSERARVVELLRSDAVKLGASDAFDTFSAAYDQYSDEWLDMTTEEFFEAGWRAALRAVAELVERDANVQQPGY